MSSRVAILETIAQQNAAGMAALRDEMRAMRTDIREELGAMRTEFREEIREVRSDVGELRHAQDRDFRLTWAGIIASAVGIVTFIAHLQHWF